MEKKGTSGAVAHHLVHPRAELVGVATRMDLTESLSSQRRVRLDEELLWKREGQTKQRSTAYFWLLGFLLALPIRIFWGLVYAPIVTWLFDLPPNTVGS